jgi:hypothetical protein
MTGAGVAAGFVSLPSSWSVTYRALAYDHYVSCRSSRHRWRNGAVATYVGYGNATGGSESNGCYDDPFHSVIGGNTGTTVMLVNFENIRTYLKHPRITYGHALKCRPLTLNSVCSFYALANFQGTYNTTFFSGATQTQRHLYKFYNCD